MTRKERSKEVTATRNCMIHFTSTTYLNISSQAHTKIQSSILHSSNFTNTRIHKQASSVVAGYYHYGSQNGGHCGSRCSRCNLVDFPQPSENHRYSDLFGYNSRSFAGWSCCNSCFVDRHPFLLHDYGSDNLPAAGDSRPAAVFDIATDTLLVPCLLFEVETYARRSALCVAALCAVQVLSEVVAPFSAEL